MACLTYNYCFSPVQFMKTHKTRSSFGQVCRRSYTHTHKRSIGKEVARHPTPILDMCRANFCEYTCRVYTLTTTISGKRTTAQITTTTTKTLKAKRKSSNIKFLTNHLAAFKKKRRHKEEGREHKLFTCDALKRKVLAQKEEDEHKMFRCHASKIAGNHHIKESSQNRKEKREQGKERWNLDIKCLRSTLHNQKRAANANTETITSQQRKELWVRKNLIVDNLESTVIGS